MGSNYQALNENGRECLVTLRRRFRALAEEARKAEAQLGDRQTWIYGNTASEPDAGDSPWRMMPVAIGIDHVIMHLSFSPRSDAALTAIMELAVEYRLVIWDPQSQDAYLPAAGPPRPSA